MRRIVKILCAISFALCLATLLCWALSTKNCERVWLRAQWKDQQKNIELTFWVFGWQTKRGFTHDHFDKQWGGDTPQSLDPLRQTLRQEYGPADHATWHWLALSGRPKWPKFDLAGFSLSRWETDEVSFSKTAIAFAILPLLWLAWMMYRKWRKRGADPAAIECEACRYDMRATPDRCPECGKARENSVTNVRM
jgi:hypothetical protein